jgi:hypothetical protein
MKKIIKTIYMLTIASFIISCVPNNPGNPSTKNRLIKRSFNYVVQDNANGRIIGSNITRLDPIQHKVIYNYNTSGKISKQTLLGKNHLGEFVTNEVQTFTYFSNYVQVQTDFYDFSDGTPTGTSTIMKLRFNADKNITLIENLDPSNMYNISFNYDNNKRLVSIFSPLGNFDNFTYNGSNLTGYQKHEFDPIDSIPLYTYQHEYIYGTDTTDRKEIINEIEAYFIPVVSYNGISTFKMTGLSFGLNSNQLISKFKSSKTIHYQNNAIVPNDHNFDISYDKDSLNRIENKHYYNVILQNEPATMDYNSDFTYQY